MFAALRRFERETRSMRTKMTTPSEMKMESSHLMVFNHIDADALPVELSY